ncbi:MAG: PAS domain-containing protein [Chloroflexi bacterium]|nr:PAS domain-containing protein [Chloroflexota bacterium]
MAGKLHPHEEILNAIRDEYRDILNGSSQGIYIYLDDPHKLCNEKFAAMLGYKSAAEWAASPQPLDDVAETSMDALVSAFQNAMNNKAASLVSVTWKKKLGGTLKTNVIVVPIHFHGEMLALHFVE